MSLFNYNQNNHKINLHDIREDYCKQELSRSQCDDNPLNQFKKWLEEAINAQVNEPTAMNLATVSIGAQNGEHRPSNRMVLLKEVNEQGFVFFTNYLSRKGQNIEHNPFVALTFFWAELERQVRIEGKIQKLSEQESDDYFESRPYASRLGAWASEQSQVIENKNILVKNAAIFGAKHPLHVPRPPHWGGYLVIPDRMEFWQGRPSRLHDRIEYLIDSNQQNNINNINWIKQRLAP